MEYEKQLRESGEYTEMQIQEKISKREILQYKVNYALDKIPKFLDHKDQTIYNLIHESANDCNSSTFREEITLHQCGYENSPGKLGEDGFVPISKRPIEVKPQNATDGKKLGGGGQFTDFTHERIKKYTDNNILMVVSGFFNGKIKFIVEFDFTSPIFRNHIINKVNTGSLLEDGTTRQRTASFGWNQWKDSNNIKLNYLSDNVDETMFTGPFLKYLKSL